MLKLARVFVMLERILEARLELAVLLAGAGDLVLLATGRVPAMLLTRTGWLLLLPDMARNTPSLRQPGRVDRLGLARLVRKAVEGRK